MAESKLQALAEEIFYYVIDHSEPRDIPVPICLGDTESAVFTEEMGKSVMYSCLLYMAFFKNKLRKHYKLLLESRLTFFCFMATTGFQVGAKGHIFMAIIRLTAFILITHAFCHEKKIVRFTDYGPMLWVKIFIYRYSESFYKAGGWKGFQKFCEVTAVDADRLNVKLDFRYDYKEAIIISQALKNWQSERRSKNENEKDEKSLNNKVTTLEKGTESVIESKKSLVAIENVNAKGRKDSLEINNRKTDVTKKRSSEIEAIESIKENMESSPKLEISNLADRNKISEISPKLDNSDNKEQIVMEGTAKLNVCKEANESGSVKMSPRVEENVAIVKESRNISLEFEIRINSKESKKSSLKLENSNVSKIIGHTEASCEKKPDSNGKVIESTKRSTVELYEKSVKISEIGERSSLGNYKIGNLSDSTEGSPFDDKNGKVSENTMKSHVQDNNERVSENTESTPFEVDNGKVSESTKSFPTEDDKNEKACGSTERLPDQTYKNEMLYEVQKSSFDESDQIGKLYKNPESPFKGKANIEIASNSPNNSSEVDTDNKKIIQIAGSSSEEAIINENISEDKKPSSEDVERKVREVKESLV